MPKLTTYKAIKKASLHWQIKLNNVAVFYKWSERKPSGGSFILVDYDKKEWFINYITPSMIYYATIDDITGQCSTTSQSVNNIDQFGVS